VFTTLGSRGLDRRGTFALMVTHGLVSRTLEIEWDRPRFELLDLRGAVLAVFDDLDVIDAYHAEGDALSLRLTGGRSARVTMTSMWIYELVGFQTGLDDEGQPDVWAIAQRVASVLGCSRVVLRVSEQHLIAWPDGSSKAEACRRGVGNLLASARDLGLYDFATVADGRTASGWYFQTEFGVVGADEVPLRLARQLGRSTSPSPLLDEELFGLDFPEVSTFVDSKWRRVDSELPEIDDVPQLIDQVDSDAAALVAALHDQVVSDASARERLTH